MERPWARRVTILAQDPSVRRGGEPLLARIEIPAETLFEGPRGYRVHVVDYDASHDCLYVPFEPSRDPASLPADPYEGRKGSALVGDPRFHSWNCYALVMATLSRFEQALGRRVPWGFNGHLLKVAPHAFAEANAFFSPVQEALLFGYFTGIGGETVFSSLSHDVVVHETTHALLAGLRSRYLIASSPDQMAFHEAFSDIVALLSVFSLKEVVELLLDSGAKDQPAHRGLVAKSAVAPGALEESVLLGLAEEMGRELAVARGNALRRSAMLRPDQVDLASDEFLEPHRRGEVLVAAVLHAFVGVWTGRLQALGTLGRGFLDRKRVAEEGADAAETLLTMAIRALDYLPPVHVTFSDFLSALLTADRELRPDDSRYAYRERLVASFGEFKIPPATKGEGLWDRPREEPVVDRSHFESLTRDPIEVSRFVWENGPLLKLHGDAHTEVLSVRPCTRRAPDGFVLRETVAEYVQVLKVKASELNGLHIEKPDGMDGETDVYLDGGTTLIFDEYGRLKFAVGTNVVGQEQSRRLAWEWECGEFDAKRVARRSFSRIHRARALGQTVRRKEEW